RRRQICSRTTTARSRSASGRVTTPNTCGTLRRSEPSVPTSWTTTRSPCGSLNRNPVMTRIRIIPALLGAAVLAACSKDGVQVITAPTAGAFIKFYNFGVNAPSVNFFANDTKLTAVSSTSCTPPTIPPNALCTTTGIESTTGTAYGAAANGGLYSSVAPGAYSFNGRIAASTDNGLQVAKLSSTLANAKHYSLYTSGFYDATAKTMDAF